MWKGFISVLNIFPLFFLFIIILGVTLGNQAPDSGGTFVDVGLNKVHNICFAQKSWLVYDM